MEFGGQDTYLPCRRWRGRGPACCFRRRRSRHFSGRATNRGSPQGRPSLTPRYAAGSIKSSKNGSSRFQVPEPARLPLWRGLPAVRRCRCHSALRILHSALVTPVPALLYGHGCPQGSRSPFPVPRPGSPFPVPAFSLGHGCPHVSGSPFPVPRCPLLGVIHNGVCPCVYVKTIKFGSKSIKKATFSVKKASKTRAFRHAHLNIWGGHPLWR